MKRNTYPQKRKTFLSLLLRGLIAAVIICAAFAGAFREYILYQIRTQTENQLNEKLLSIQEQIDYIENKTDEQFVLRDMSYKMSIHTIYDIYIRQLIDLNNDNDAIQVTPYCSQNNHAICALLDENNNIAASNILSLRTVVRPNEDDTDSGLYLCDNKELGIPQLDELFADIEEFYYRCGNTGTGSIELTLDSIYYDRSRKIFIPRNGRLTLKRAKVHRDLLYEENSMNVEEEREIHIDLEGIGYETMDKGGSNNPPYFGLTMIMGVPASEFENYGKDFEYCINDEGIIDMSFYGRASGENFNEVTRTLPVYINGKAYQLYMRFIVDERDPKFVQFYYKWVSIFSAVTLAVTLLLCWRKNVLNKAKYAFEDYQSDLTDSLAHDIKTPLMAISGYTENVMKGMLGEAEQNEYLKAILDNIAFTDQLVSRTLCLNHMGRNSDSQPEQIKLAETTEDMLAKYALMLQEKQITYSVSGNAEIKADKTAVETIIENLISNAVKYTPKDGSIKITINKKQITVTNSVEKKINTAKLTRPFVRGDASRSNIEGNGLGLAIAERAALANRFKLLLSCTDTEFRTELRY